MHYVEHATQFRDAESPDPDTAHLLTFVPAQLLTYFTCKLQAKRNNVLFYFWEHPNYSRLVNRSVDPYPANECGVLPASIDDFGFDWKGKLVTKRPGKGKGKAASGPKVTCFPLLDESPEAGADDRRIDPTPTNPLGEAVHRP